MTMKLTRSAYQDLIREDIEWLEKQPRTLERDHVIEIVRESEKYYYDAESDRENLQTLHEQVADMCEFLGSKRDEVPCDSWHLRDLIRKLRDSALALAVAVKRQPMERLPVLYELAQRILNPGPDQR